MKERMLQSKSRIPNARECVYQLKVTLKGSRPSIWRQFQVLSDISLHKLHLILQVVMGWDNYHLYRFEIGGIQYGEPDPEDDFYGLKFKNSKRTRLADVVREKNRFLYEYDFGDSWEHEIVVEKILSPESGKSYPVCIDGKRRCPPEDCGGIWGYADMLKVIRNPEHEEYEDTMEWLGGQFDSEVFDLREVNSRLNRIRS